MINNNPMMEKYVTISWCPTDVKAARPDLTDAECMEALEKVGGVLEDRSIELGWEVLENLLYMHFPIEYDDNESDYYA